MDKVTILTSKRHSQEERKEIVRQEGDLKGENEDVFARENKNIHFTRKRKSEGESEITISETGRQEWFTCRHTREWFDFSGRQRVKIRFKYCTEQTNMTRRVYRQIYRRRVKYCIEQN